MPSETLRHAYRAFTTGCALITTQGADGPNVMAAEWTFNVSYHPFLILVSIDPANRTHDVIRETREFGVNMVAEDQIAAMAFAGHYSKADTDKLSSELFVVEPAKTIKAPMIRGSLLQAECRLVQEIPLGDHMGFLGEVVEFRVEPDRKPVVLHHGSRHLGERIVRSPSVSMAITPMHASPGAAISVTGELTGEVRGGVAVSLDVQGPEPLSLGVDDLRSSEGGEFRVSANLPAKIRPGRYTVTGRTADTKGSAEFEVG